MLKVHFIAWRTGQDNSICNLRHKSVCQGVFLPPFRRYSCALLSSLYLEKCKLPGHSMSESKPQKRPRKRKSTSKQSRYQSKRAHVSWSSRRCAWQEVTSVLWQVDKVLWTSRLTSWRGTAEIKPPPASSFSHSNADSSHNTSDRLELRI